jgi:hypothetical protein
MASWILAGTAACSGSVTAHLGSEGGATNAVGGTTLGQGGASTLGGTTGLSVGGMAKGGSAPQPTGGRNATGGTTPANTGGKSTGGANGTGGSTAVAPGGAAAGGNTVGGNTVGGNTVGGSTVGGTSSSPILEPATGALLGLYYGDASIAATATKLGRTVPLHLTYYAFSDDWTTDATADDLRAGRVPFVNWELFGATLDDIAGGTYDTLINQRAAAAKKLGNKFFIDFGAEMNGDWSPWSGAENGQSGAKYIAAYRHVHDIFVAAGATNAIWAFCPNVTSVPDATWNEPLDYYPGDSYVDWMCVDGYNWGTSQAGNTWQSFYQVFKDIYPVLASKNKPIIIGEMASTELGGDKSAWISQIIPAMKNQFPLFKGLLWFDVNKETDWRISSSAASEAAFKTMANDPWFVP